MTKIRKVFRCDGECDRILRLSLAHKVGLLQRSGSFKTILLCSECFCKAGYHLKNKGNIPSMTLTEFKCQADAVKGLVEDFMQATTMGSSEGSRKGTILDNTVMLSGFYKSNQPDEPQGQLIIPEGKDGQSET